MSVIIVLRTIQVSHLFVSAALLLLQSEEIFLDMFEDEYREMTVSCVNTLSPTTKLAGVVSCIVHNSVSV